MPVDESFEKISARAEDLVRTDREFLAALIHHREKHGLTQADVAERMGVSQSTVSSFERYDANPTMATIRRYALAVGVRTRKLVDDDCGEDLSVVLGTMFKATGTAPKWVAPEVNTIGATGGWNWSVLMHRDREYVNA
jgi:transcriptional regulator with XRE-family HTH domain